MFDERENSIQTISATGRIADQSAFLQGQTNTQADIDHADNFALPFQDDLIAAKDVAETTCADCKHDRADKP